MTKYNLTLPKMGESVDEATIVNWLKNIGDKIDMDDFVVEVDVCHDTSTPMIDQKKQGDNVKVIIYKNTQLF